MIGDEKYVKFWKDKWLLDRPLMETVITAIPDEIIDAKVADLWENGVGWSLSQIVSYDGTHTQLQLVSVVLNNVTGARDRVSWEQTQNGEFSVKSAYAFLTRDRKSKPNMQSLFNRVWHITAPERTRVFLWLVAN